MDYQEMLKVLEADNPEYLNIKHCVVCGMEFVPYHSRQKTCGSPECKKAHHDKYTREYHKQAENRQRIQEAKLRYRRKQQNKKLQERNADKIEEHWQKQHEFDERVKEYGDHYGEVQKQKILSGVPKIKTEL